MEDSPLSLGDEEPLRRAIQQVPFPVMIHTEDGKVLFLNKAWTEMSGYAQQEIPTVWDWMERALGQRRNMALGEVDRLFAMKEALNEGEYTVTTRDSQQRVWDFNIIPFGMDSQGRRLLMRMAADVTERNLADRLLQGWNEQLEQRVQERTQELAETVEALKAEIAERKRVESYKDEILYAVSHELRTPLAITKEGISLVMRGIPGTLNPQQRDILTIARDNIDRLTRMINSLLDMSKLKAGKIELKRVPVDLGALMREVGASFQEKLAQKGLGLKVTVPPECPKAYADPDRIFQVFTNLVGNAVKFTDRGTIEISARESGEEVECAVTDTGRGISQEDFPRVFGKFEQFGRKEGAGEKGTGLGLAISKGLVELHRGRIWVESRLGEGTRFAFTLPRHAPGVELRTFVREGIHLAQERALNLALLLVPWPGGSPSPPGWTEAKLQGLSQWWREWVQGCVERQTAPVSRAWAAASRFPAGLAAVLVGFAPGEVRGLRGELRDALRKRLVQEGADDVELEVGFAALSEECRDEARLIAKAEESLDRRA